MVILSAELNQEEDDVKLCLVAIQRFYFRVIWFPSGVIDLRVARVASYGGTYDNVACRSPV
jgi:hypothetical protein